MKYASFGERLIAHIIDVVIITVPTTIVMFLISLIGGILYFNPNDREFQLIYNVVFMAIFIFYHAEMESSDRQGSFGKNIMRIKVTNERGKPVTYEQAFKRNLAKILSNLIVGIGHLMIIWDKKKQALHDKLADCLVIDK